MKQLLTDNLQHVQADKEHVLNLLAMLGENTIYQDTKQSLLRQLELVSQHMEHLTQRLREMDVNHANG